MIPYGQLVQRLREPVFLYDAYHLSLRTRVCLAHCSGGSGSMVLTHLREDKPNIDL